MVILNYWFFFIIGIIWTLGVFAYIYKKIWNKIYNRYINVVSKKIINYHYLCLTAISKNDWDKVSYILRESLKKYDPISPITFFIKGAYIIGAKDINELGFISNEIEKIKNERFNRV